MGIYIPPAGFPFSCLFFPPWGNRLEELSAATMDRISSSYKLYQPLEVQCFKMAYHLGSGQEQGNVCGNLQRRRWFGLLWVGCAKTAAWVQSGWLGSNGRHRRRRYWRRQGPSRTTLEVCGNQQDQHHIYGLSEITIRF